MLRGELSRADRLRVMLQAAAIQTRALPSQLSAVPNSSPATPSLVPPPDSALARDALEHAREVLTPGILAHSLRCWQWAMRFRALDGNEPDPEALFVACVLHDTAHWARLPTRTSAASRCWGPRRPGGSSRTGAPLPLRRRRWPPQSRATWTRAHPPGTEPRPPCCTTPLTSTSRGTGFGTCRRTFFAPSSRRSPTTGWARSSPSSRGTRAGSGPDRRSPCCGAAGCGFPCASTLLTGSEITDRGDDGIACARQEAELFGPDRTRHAAHVAVMTVRPAPKHEQRVNPPPEPDGQACAVRPCPTPGA